MPEESQLQLVLSLNVGKSKTKTASQKTPKSRSAAVGVVLHIHRVVHGGCGRMSFFVGSDVGVVLHCRADVVESLQLNFLARGGNFKFKHQAVPVADGLVRQIHGQRIAFFLVGTLEKFVYFRFAERGGQDAVLETIVVKNVRVTWRDDHAEAVILPSPRSMLAAGAAAEVGARQQNRRAFVARKI